MVEIFLLMESCVCVYMVGVSTFTSVGERVMNRQVLVNKSVPTVTSGTMKTGIYIIVLVIVLISNKFMLTSVDQQGGQQYKDVPIAYGAI